MQRGEKSRSFVFADRLPKVYNVAYSDSSAGWVHRFRSLRPLCPSRNSFCAGAQLSTRANARPLVGRGGLLCVWLVFFHDLELVSESTSTRKTEIRSSSRLACVRRSGRSWMLCDCSFCHAFRSFPFPDRFSFPHASLLYAVHHTLSSNVL